MNERVLAIIMIGGRLIASRAFELIEAIRSARLYTHTGDVLFEPETLADLICARTPDGYLHLCDDEAEWGEMPMIQALCRKHGLPYKLWHESTSEFGALVEIWAPGMSYPMTITGDHCDPEIFLVSGPKVRRALELLEEGKVDEAERRLREIIPTMPELPHFELVEGVLSPIEQAAPAQP